jgi:transcriptional regulator with XRE-family HTH domain
MDSSRVSRILDGSQSPTSLDYALIAEACQVTVDWLLTGKGAREINPIVCRVEEVRLPSVRVYTDAEDAEMLGEADPHDPNCWSNQ